MKTNSLPIPRWVEQKFLIGRTLSALLWLWKSAYKVAIRVLNTKRSPFTLCLRLLLHPDAMSQLQDVRPSDIGCSLLSIIYFGLLPPLISRYSPMNLEEIAPVTHLYIRHLYAIINEVMTTNINEEGKNLNLNNFYEVVEVQNRGSMIFQRVNSVLSAFIFTIS